MGLDIYAGTLTRYYIRNWKTITQQFSEQYGFNYKVIRQSEDGQREQTARAEDVYNIVCQWKNRIENYIGSGGKWAEDYDKTPYYTDKPDWDAYNALRLVIAFKSQGKDFPNTVKKGFCCDDIDGFGEIYSHIKGQSILLDGCEMYVPLFKDAYFEYVNPAMEKSRISTSLALMEELDRINSNIWGADRQTIMSWTTDEGYPVEVTADENGKIIHKTTQTDEYDTQSLAKFAFSIMFRACEFSLKNGVCLVLDF